MRIRKIIVSVVSVTLILGALSGCRIVKKSSEVVVEDREVVSEEQEKENQQEQEEADKQQQMGDTKEADDQQEDKKQGMDKQGEKDSQDLLDDQDKITIQNQEFLASFEGMQYQISAYYFQKAFFEGDYEYIKNHCVEAAETEKYDYVNQFDQIEYSIYRISEYDEKNQTVHSEFVVLPKKDGSCVYLDFQMQLVDGEWKIVKYLLDA